MAAVATLALPAAPAGAVTSIPLPYIMSGGRYLSPDPAYQVISTGTPAEFTAVRFGAGWAFYQASTGYEYSNDGGCAFYFCDDAGAPLYPVGMYGVRCWAGHPGWFWLYSYEYGRYAVMRWLPDGRLAPEFTSVGLGSPFYARWCGA